MWTPDVGEGHERRRTHLGSWAQLTTMSLDPQPPLQEPPLPQAWPPLQGGDIGSLGRPAHLHVHEELPEVARGQHDGGVELNDVALVQGDVVVGCEALHRRRGHVSLCG